MSQVTKRTRVQRLADSVLPGRTVGGYANLIEARLRKLAATDSTGMLPLSGHGDGAIFFRGGQVVYAESTRTPTPVRRSVGLAALGLVATDASPASNGAELVPMPSLDRLFGMLALTEPTIDAITELLSNESRYAKFRPSDYPAAGQAEPAVDRGRADRGRAPPPRPAPAGAGGHRGLARRPVRAQGPAEVPGVRLAVGAAGADRGREHAEDARDGDSAEASSAPRSRSTGCSRSACWSCPATRPRSPAASPRSGRPR